MTSFFGLARKWRSADFLDALLPTVASYLPPADCTVFAMTMVSSLQHNAGVTCKAMAARVNWDRTLDFGNVQERIQGSLTDEDVRWILICLDAVSNVKSVKLTDCLGIVGSGSGLGPLRGSTVLERVDLSLVGYHKSPDIDPEPPISVEAVIPILDSIIDIEGNSLAHVQLPKKWCFEWSEGEELIYNFLKRFGRLLNDRSRRVKCSNDLSCDRTCERDEDSPVIKLDSDDDGYGIIRNTCYECMGQFCADCPSYDSSLQLCTCCEKFICHGCTTIEHCQGPDCQPQISSCDQCDVVKTW